MKNKQITLGAILSYSSILLNICAGLLYTPWMVGQIGESDYGLYTLANSLIALFLVDFGLSVATSRFISKYVAEGRFEKANTCLGVIYKLYLIIDVVLCAVFLVVFFFLEHIYVSLSPEELQKFKVVYCIAAGFAVINFPFVPMNGILTAHEKFIQLKSADIIHRILSISLTILALYNGMGLYALVAANAISGLAILVYKYWMIRRCTPTRAVFETSDRSLYRSIFSFSIWVTMDSLASRLFFAVTPTILGVVSNSTQIAVFGIVSAIEGYCYMFTTAINGMFMPKISRIYSKDPDGGALEPLMIKVGRFQFATNGLIIVGFAVLGNLFVKLWMGETFLNAYYGVLLVILPGLFFNSLQVANTAIAVQNKVKEQALIAVICGLINVAVSFAVSYYLGAIGACLAIFISYTIRAILYHIVHKKVLHIDIWRFIKECYLKMFPPLLITLLAGFCINHLIPDFGWISFIVKGILLVVVYLILLLSLGLTKEERVAITRYFKKQH